MLFMNTLSTKIRYCWRL